MENELLVFREELLREIVLLREALLRDISLLKWILGGLFVAVGGLLGVMVKVAILMFGWRREIDGNIADNTTEIAVLVQWKATHMIEAERTRDELRLQRERIMELGNRQKPK